ncbi:hypothetical protein ACFWDG_26220 [Peribacillus sp. NPDC060186]
MTHLNYLERVFENWLTNLLRVGVHRPGSKVYKSVSSLGMRYFELTIEGIRLRIYKPSEKINLPMLMFYHGGCFVSGDFETHDR